MLGALYERALAGEPCWIRHQHGDLVPLPVDRWLGRRLTDDTFDTAVLQLCCGPVLDIGCGPARLVAQLAKEGICALGVDQSPVAIELARRSGASAVRCDIFYALPLLQHWRTALLIDGNVGIGGDPHRLLGKVRELLGTDGRCLVEFETTTTGIRKVMVRLESASQVGPWFPWATVGVDSAHELARDCGFEVERLCMVDDRVVASLTSV
jgi:SAM-dependent methyltransferase